MHANKSRILFVSLYSSSMKRSTPEGMAFTGKIDRHISDGVYPPHQAPYNVQPLKREVPNEMAFKRCRKLDEPLDIQPTHYDPIMYNYDDYVYGGSEDDVDDAPLPKHDLEAERRLKALDAFHATLVGKYTKPTQVLRVSATTPQQLALNGAYNRNTAHTNILSTDTFALILGLVSLESIVSLSQISSYHARFVSDKLKESPRATLHVERIASMVQYFDSRCVGILGLLRTSVSVLCIVVNHNPWETDKERSAYIKNARSKWGGHQQYHRNPYVLESIKVGVSNLADIRLFMDIIPLPNIHLTVYYRDSSHFLSICDSVYNYTTASVRLVRDHAGNFSDTQ